VEATATGNILMQAIALGHLGSLAEARAFVRKSFGVEFYHPSHPDGWEDAYEKLESLTVTNQF
jgi:rhamnulokinase